MSSSHSSIDRPATTASTFGPPAFRRDPEPAAGMMSSGKSVVLTTLASRAAGQPARSSVLLVRNRGESLPPATVGRQLLTNQNGQRLQPIEPCGAFDFLRGDGTEPHGHFQHVRF